MRGWVVWTALRATATTIGAGILGLFLATAVAAFIWAASGEMVGVWQGMVLLVLCWAAVVVVDGVLTGLDRGRLYIRTNQRAGALLVLRTDRSRRARPGDQRAVNLVAWPRGRDTGMPLLGDVVARVHAEGGRVTGEAWPWRTRQYDRQAARQGFGVEHTPVLFGLFFRLATRTQ